LTAPRAQTFGAGAAGDIGGLALKWDIWWHSIHATIPLAVAEVGQRMEVAWPPRRHLGTIEQ